MRLISLLLAALAAAQCAHSFVVQRAPIAGRMPTSVRRTPTMCVPKEVAAAILVVGAGFLLTQGVPPAKAEDMLATGSGPTIGECERGAAHVFAVLHPLELVARREVIML